MIQFPFFDFTTSFLMFAVIGIVIFVIIIIIIIIILKSIFSNMKDYQSNSKKKSSTLSYETQNPSEVLNPYRANSQKAEPAGTKLEEKQEEVESGFQFCQYCGEKIPSNAKFCPQCGSKAK